MNKRTEVIWSIKLAMAGLIVWGGWVWLRGDSDVSAFFGFLFFSCCFIAIFFMDILHGLSRGMIHLIYPDVDNVEIRPQYSVAEARVKEGKYEEAIAEFRKVWQQFPNDVTVHVRIAEILCQHFQRYEDAVAELKAALEKQTKPEAWVFLANRLVDVQVEHLHDFVGARETLQRILLKYPATEYAEAATARCSSLNAKEVMESLPERPPLKVPDSGVE